MNIRCMQLLYKMLSYCRDYARRIHKPHSVKWRKMATTPFKVIHGHRFRTNRNHVCDFVLLNNTTLHPISSHLRVAAEYWSNYRLWQGCLYLHTFGGEPLNSRLWNLASRNYRHHIIDYYMMCKTFRYLSRFRRFQLCTLQMSSANNDVLMTLLIRKNYK